MKGNKYENILHIMYHKKKNWTSSTLNYKGCKENEKKKRNKYVIKNIMFKGKQFVENIKRKRKGKGRQNGKVRKTEVDECLNSNLKVLCWVKIVHMSPMLDFKCSIDFSNSILYILIFLHLFP